ncbi:hypothetical protein SAMN04490243_0154 [Robiginitalea myxolifaciens]|uniref:Oligosaccharide repeat unit polymerase n=1 Tax=Robiginitalea myxolifaciens TaxID=400055 RepID=A0A1I6FNF3_9FLAO|nr:O-antigen polymerase [Robiginitalea myxolifaciens]SFR31327.1 hypothetical protein SAMN04490243_0154 [Robiginitalea myxolifaciens]
MNLTLSKAGLIKIRLVIWLLFSVYLVTSFFIIESFDLKVSIVITGVLIQLTLIEFLSNWQKLGRPKLLDWFRLSTFLGLVLNFLFLIFLLDNRDGLLVHNVVIVNSKIALKCLLVILTALISLKLGEYISKELPQLRTRKLNEYRHLLLLKNLNLLYFIIGCFAVAKIYLVINGFIDFDSNPKNLNPFQSLINQITITWTPIFLVFMSIIIFRYEYSDRRFYLVFIVFLVLQVILGFLSGSKESIISPILIVGIPYLISGKKISLKYFLSFLVIVVLIYPINNRFRSLTNQGLELSQPQMVKEAISKTLENNISESFVLGLESYQKRVSMFAILMYSIENEKYWNEYKFMDRYVFLPIAWIVPRIVLPNKPTADIGRRLYEMTTGNDSTSITPTTYGWAYMEGGTIYVLLSFILLGIAIGYFELNLSLSNPLGLMIYALILIRLLKIEFDIYSMITSILQIVLLCLITNKMFFSQKKIKIG